MPGLRKMGGVGLIGGLAALVVGFVFAGGSAVVAGDWWLAREPWIGIGLNLIVIGLGATAVFAVILDVFEPLGWLRLIALPPALLLAGVWAIYLIIGVPSTGFGGAEHDPRTIIYSAPTSLVLLVVLTLLVALPLLLGRRVRGGGVTPAH